jgi:integrase/recombinase XerD
MQNFEKTFSRVGISAFIDYKPAELKTNKDWLIVYYAKNPVTGKLERHRLRVPFISNKKERLLLGKKIALEINNRFAQGWSPYLEETGKNYKTFDAAIEEFLTSIKKQLKDGVLRADTIRAYTSNTNLLKEFIVKKNIKITFALEINKRFCTEYLDFIYIDRKNSPRTRNNHLGFLKLICGFLVDRGVLSENPVNGIKPMLSQPKKRAVFPDHIKKQINDKLLTYDNEFYTLCMTTYFCLIRNTELGKLKVSMINLKENYIFLPKEISKNKKDEAVTIPVQFLEVLKKHINPNFPDDFVFSADNFKQGTKQMPVRKIASAFDKLRADLKLESKYQFYSFKDTGITDLLNSGIPAIKVRDQARHYDIKITELYTPRNKSCDNVVQNAIISF